MLPPRSLLRCALLACLFAGATIASAQQRPGMVSFARLALPDDVPAHLTTAMTQDAQGLLWIGTQGGLVRYDGYGYKVFRARPGDPQALGGSYIRALHAARDGRLWVGTISSGLSVFDPRTERFTQYRHDPRQPDSLASDRVESVAELADGSLWLATDGGLSVLDPASGRFRRYLAGSQLRAVLQDREGRLWVAGQAGLQRWLGEGRFSAPVGPGNATRLFQDSQGRIWIASSREGAAVYEPASGRLQAVPKLGHYWVYSIAEPVPGEIWLGTFGQGIDVVDGASLAVLERLRHDGTGVSSIGNDRIGALLVDRSGIAWAGTWGGGIARHDPASRAFLKLRHSPANPHGPSHPAIVRALEAADGRLWLGTNGNGVDVLDAGGKLAAGFRPDPTRPDALADGAITCLAQGPDGSMWVATLDGTLHRQRPGQAGFQRLGTAHGLPGGPIRAMLFGADGALWAGSQHGLARLGADGAIRAWRHDPADPASLSGREVESLAFTPDGTLWVGTNHGINAFDTASGRAQRIYRDPARADSLPDNWVPDLMVDKDGQLWLATQAGVAILRGFDGKTAQFDLLSSRLKLPAQPPESLLQDAQGQVWLGSRIRIDPLTWRWRSFDRADGNEFRTLYYASRARMRNGDLLFGSPEGLLRVRPQLLRRWDYQPAVTATALSIDGVEQPGAGVLAARTLQPGQHDLRLEFAAPDFSAPELQHYRYRLDGYDAGWVNVDARQRVAAYSHLPPGDYQLRVQASNRAGQWSPQEWRLQLHVQPAFYQTWWFRSALWLLGALGVFGLFRLRLRQLRRRGAQLERLVAERTAALEAASRRLEQASLTDPLTGLHNRRYLEQTIQADFDLAARRHRSVPPEPHADLVLFMLDLDHFKRVNDEYGHAAGDAVLQQTAAVLRACMRSADHIVRWGGEEFLLLARFIERSDAPALAEKIRCAIAAHHFTIPGGQVLRKTVSIGFAAFPGMPGRPSALTPEALQRVADAALYAAKHTWRDAWVGVQARSGEAGLSRFLADPTSAVAAGDVELLVPPQRGRVVNWH
ncbi:two-component regulator propeller domain-containing protein [Pseudoduganella sp.]|uniref:ligand-binding sensor domain-containing diguanylate cyclase n=1 Tax=Pseudoduganella sp. TaxID=1880898 RepID=UPI0035B117C0